MERLTIGQLARQTGVTVETLRFYEKEQLLPQPIRLSNGYRAYTQQATDRVAFIQRSKALGFSLKEIRELLALRQDENSDAADYHHVVEEKLQHIQEKIDDLQRMRDALQGLLEACPGEGTAETCPIARTLAGDPIEHAAQA
ncbi:MAG: MerR family transcriptional regulator Zn(II)-responsive regulator of zntA [Puniceicoccaceae bacterium 5H]|nr:MAG: MerR family transcriptional regulator Zn(II)-responsive regulator of zntA [Puniceicoccaceae bacterium 5H]